MIQAFYLLSADPKSGGTVQLLMMGAIMLVFYMFMIRPQAKKAKTQKQFINDIKKGDKVVTIAGIHGVVNRVNDDNATIQLEVNPGSYMKIEKSAISLEWSQALNKPVATTTETK
ncbi:preprotein translocase subunit YajC [Segetibacter koreensis]|uniref:preprotein translocase subunit YajC n=1 Tax=Segetibacter koreensis TaxID=398037 RepID=UPI000360EADD|nr:preprotein translocase subunit YajC [Segetibacter koreensis]